MPDLSAQLALSRSHLLTADRIVAGQIALMRRLADDGHDLRSAWQLLALFEDIQSEMAQHHRLLVRDTDERNARGRADMSAIGKNPVTF